VNCTMPMPTLLAAGRQVGGSIVHEDAPIRRNADPGGGQCANRRVRLAKPHLVGDDHPVEPLREVVPAVRVLPTGYQLPGQVSRQCVPHRGHPGDVAAALVFFPNPAASFVTGQSLHADSGCLL
jgi:NAD(P)-dependent dehydrogenase (short-subunit alcohol dehydrogenase family)